ncbi:MAG: 1-acyl-sn-glycerol-3-phosphate acyltransferase [Burkholderiales bacterium]|nr:1-acyl-sn-glycerol-3-phosphate acyltransferase [Burkholderiales bacterium]
MALPIPLRGSTLARAALRLAGWRLRFDGLPARQGVLIVYPHTSNWDFVLGIVVKWAVGIQITFWGKASLFELPLFGRWLRWLGGVPVDRTSPNGIVGQMAREISAARADDRFFWLALSPEGTRHYTAAWRSGFYHVALQAQVPVGLVFLDYGRRTVGVERFVTLSGDPVTDLATIEHGLRQPVGRRPELAAPIRFES